LLGFLLGRSRAWGLLWVTAAVVSVVVGWNLMQAQAATSGWDGLAIMLLVLLYLLPGLAGLLSGAALAWWMGRKTGS